MESIYVPLKTTTPHPDILKEQRSFENQSYNRFKKQKLVGIGIKKKDE